MGAKTICASILYARWGALFCMLAVSAAAAGNLEPPGAPAPTMKTLDQVEPRISVQSLPNSATALHTITQPGSYYLTGDLVGVAGKNGVEIQAERVTLDLSGYRLVGVPGSLNGVVVLGGLVVGNRIENGTIHGWGQNGILLNQGVGPGGGCIVASLARIIAARNGQNGVRVVGGGSADQTLFVREAALTSNGADGLSSDLAVDAQHLVASGNAAHGVVVLGGIVADSVFEANGADGVVVLGGIVAHGGRVSDSISARNGGAGIVLGDGMRATGCECVGNAADGIRAASNGRIEGCSIHYHLNPNAAAIHVNGVRTRVDGNHVTDNSVAFKVEQPGNLLIRNSAGGNGDAFGQVVQGNDVGPIGPAAQAQSPWSNILF